MVGEPENLVCFQMKTEWEQVGEHRIVAKNCFCSTKCGVIDNRLKLRKNRETPQTYIWLMVSLIVPRRTFFASLKSRVACIHI